MREQSRVSGSQKPKARSSPRKRRSKELRDELQSWRDNLPENLQYGEKAGELDEAMGGTWKIWPADLTTRTST